LTLHFGGRSVDLPPIVRDLSEFVKFRMFGTLRARPSLKISTVALQP
jgi:hypothetical protein